MSDINYIYIYIEHLIVTVLLDMELIGKTIISYIVIILSVLEYYFYMIRPILNAKFSHFIAILIKFHSK